VEKLGDGKCTGEELFMWEAFSFWTWFFLFTWRMDRWGAKSVAGRVTQVHVREGCVLPLLRASKGYQPL
jgi:hypothetical protein